MKGVSSISVEALVNAPVDKVWDYWTTPTHIVFWNNASDDWHTPKATNDLKVGGKFSYRMEAKDGSAGFDFDGIYEEIVPHQLIVYRLSDGRKVEIKFSGSENETHIIETFIAENENPIKEQKSGWQAILNNFKKYVEGQENSEVLHFEITINAAVEKVYQTMIDEKHYATWTSEFNPTSHYKGSWEKGAKILFLGSDGEGNVGGMVSRIKENIPNKFLSIEHLGIVQGTKEITEGPEVEGWAGALENYSFQAVGNQTLLSVDMDSNEAFKSYFMETWPKALQKLKGICE